MARWRGDWEFVNITSSKHRSCGREIVSASTEAEAKEAIKLEASKDLFGTTMMQTYVEVRNLIRVEDWR